MQILPSSGHQMAQTRLKSHRIRVDYAVYEGAAQLAYHTRRRRPVTIPKPPAGSVWSAPSQLSAASAVWVVAAEWRPTARPEEFFSQVIPHAPLPIVARGREVRRFMFWTATGPRP